MLKHFMPGKEYQPENPNRIKAIWNKLDSAGITQRCVVLNAKEAEEKYVALVHAQYHVQFIKNISSKELDSSRKMIALNCDSVYLNRGSSEAAFLAGCCYGGELDSAVAVVRPPGHHAEPDLARGFCLFNNVAVAASYLLNERTELGIRKILIVDWDVHHGNGTQKVFWKDNRVLVFSVHRYDNGTFYPPGKDGCHSMVGEGLGAGYNVNVPWESAGCGDADYFAVWDHVLIPITKVRQELSRYWPVLADEFPKNSVTNFKKKFSEMAALQSKFASDLVQHHKQLAAKERSKREETEALCNVAECEIEELKKRLVAAEKEASAANTKVKQHEAKSQELGLKVAKLEAAKSAAEVEAAKAKQQAIELGLKAAKLEAAKSEAEVEAAEAKQQVVESQRRAARAEKNVIDAEQLVAKERQQREALKKTFEKSFKQLQEFSLLLGR
ncbi:hypothetical protein MKX01_008587 [Papaver californicum]|nr:hypothetical protein MKX01_008587 [Papaver californicum]